MNSPKDEVAGRVCGDGGKAPERLDRHAVRPNDGAIGAIDRKEQHDESSA